jgi:CMP-N,N'-diacetyllegionaminic acid synthase
MSDKPLVLIPARSGSQGVKDKNTRLDAGPSLLQLAIAIGKEVGEVWVSTRDRDAIAQAQAAGVPIEYRSRGLDQPDTPMDAVVSDFVLGRPHEPEERLLVLLQPTSPQRTVAQVTRAIELAHSLCPVVTVEPIPAHSRPDLLRFYDDGRLVPVLPGERVTARQAAREAFRRNGIAYVSSVAIVRGTSTLEGTQPRPLFTPPTLTIDTHEDWQAWVRLQQPPPAAIPWQVHAEIAARAASNPK